MIFSICKSHIVAVIAVFLVCSTSFVYADLDSAIRCIQEAGVVVYGPSEPLNVKAATAQVNLVNSSPPLAAVKATSEDQVQVSVKCLKDNGVKAVPQGGGASYEGASVLPDAVTIDVSGLNSINYIDNTVEVGAGMRFKNLYYQLDQRNGGLETVVGGYGLSPSVAGFILNGGLSPFSRKFGLGCDQLVSITMVNSTGELVTATPTQNSDLFWASCGGGGGNFGIVVRLRLNLVQIPPVTYTYFSIAPTQAAAFLNYWQSTVARKAGPDVMLKAVAYASSVDVYSLYPGSTAGATAALSMAGLGTASGFQYVDYNAQQMTWLQAIQTLAFLPNITSASANNDREEKEVRYYDNVNFLTTEPLASEVTKIIQQWAIENTASEAYVGFDIMNSNSAVANKADDASAFPYRTSLQLISYGIEWESSIDTQKNQALMKSLTTKLEPYIGSDPPAWSAFTSDMLPATTLYGSNLPRLETIKAAYDPENYFTSPSGITPSSANLPPSPVKASTSPPSPVADLSTSPPAASSSSGTSTAAIVGGVVGGIVVAALAGALIYFYVAKKKVRERSVEAAVPNPAQTAPPTQPDVAIGSAVWTTTTTGNGYRGNSNLNGSGGGTAARVLPATAAAGAVQPNTRSPSSSYPSPMEARPFNISNDPMLSWIASLPESTSSIPSSAGGSTSTNETAAMEPWLFKFRDITIIHPLGEGSFGKVYLAKWRETPVAVKMLISSSDPSASKAEALTLGSPDLTGLRREAGLMASMRHPNIVNFLGLCTYPPCVATEFCQRGSLFAVLRAAAANPEEALQLTWERRIDMAIDAARGLLYLHSFSPPVIHRDLKSPNLLVSTDWSVKVADFNLSKLAAPHATQTQTLGAMNPRWISPEVIDGENATPASDIYSFGTVLWEMLTWDLPFMGVNEFLIMRKVINGERPAIPPINELPGIPFGTVNGPPGFALYVELVQRCWAGEPQQRPSIQNVLASLEAVKECGRSS